MNKKILMEYKCNNMLEERSQWECLLHFQRKLVVNPLTVCLDCLFPTKIATLFVDIFFNYFFTLYISNRYSIFFFYKKFRNIKSKKSLIFCCKWNLTQIEENACQTKVFELLDKNKKKKTGKCFTNIVNKNFWKGKTSFETKLKLM